MPGPAALPPLSERDELKPSGTIVSGLTTILCLGIAFCGVGYACFWTFSGFERYDDEGVVMLFVQHMLDGHPIYDRVDCLYGPFYLLARWVVFGVLQVPLGNDSLRVETLVTWLATTVLLAMTTWHLVRGLSCRVGVTALVWVLMVSQLFVLSRESGHPQEVVAFLIAAALLVAGTMTNRRSLMFVLLGGLGAAIVLTKVNVGVVYLVGLAVSLLALTPSSAFWLALRGIATCAALILPWMLMKSRLSDGYGGFCLLMTSSILPCLCVANFKIRPGTVRLGEWLWCSLGMAIVTCLSVAFALWQGNTLSGMVNAVVLRPWINFAGAPVGRAMSTWGPALAWAPLGAALGLATLRGKLPWSRILWPLRIFACVPIVTIATARTLEFALPIYVVLPLVWLVLVPPKDHVPSEPGWFFRLFLAFTACLEPLQIFPVSGSQKFVGTLVFPVVAVVLALDARQEIRDLARSQPHFFSSRVPAFKRLAVVAVAVVLMRLRGYEVFGGVWWLPSAASCWGPVRSGDGAGGAAF